MADQLPIMIAKFWSRVGVTSNSQCWLWRGRRGHKDYGRWQRTMAHRFAYELVKGPIPEGLLVCHTCDTPLCCTPRHLKVGTYKDNSRDCVERGRIAHGETHGRTKITAEQASHIRRNPDGLKLRELAAQFGLAISTVSYIRSGSLKTWKHLPQAETV